MFRFLIVALIPALVLGQTQVQTCTGGRPAPNQVNVHGCIVPPCDIFQGSAHAMDVHFTSHNLVQSLRPSVFATALGLTIEYQLDAEFYHGCNFLQQNSCPLAAGTDAIYNFIFPVPSIYPPIPVTVELSLLDEMNRPVFCTVISIHVRAP